MRPATPRLSDREQLAEYIEDCADRVDGRVGVVLAHLDGRTVEDADVLVTRHEDRPYASASVIKLALLYALYRLHDAGLDTLDDPREITPENRVGGAGCFHLLDRPQPSLRDLARAMIAVSDNAATNELIDYVGMDAVNRAASDLGMDRTRVGRKMMTTLERTSEVGDGDGTRNALEKPVNTTSPLDCARLFNELLHGDDLSARARTEQLDILRNQKDRSMFGRYVPYETSIAHKTGWLPTAALDTGFVERGDRPPLFFAVFCDQAAHGGDATDVIAEIGDATIRWLRDTDSL